jgi:hypothetical protein
MKAELNDEIFFEHGNETAYSLRMKNIGSHLRNSQLFKRKFPHMIAWFVPVEAG